MEREAFGFDHSELGARLAERWAFPETLCDAIREHEQVPIEPNGSGLTYVVGHANHLCNRFGYGAGWTASRARRLTRATASQDPRRSPSTTP